MRKLEIVMEYEARIDGFKGTLERRVVVDTPSYERIDEQIDVVTKFLKKFDGQNAIVTLQSYDAERWSSETTISYCRIICGYSKPQYIQWHSHNHYDESEIAKLTRRDVKAAFVYALNRLNTDNEQTA